MTACTKTTIIEKISEKNNQPPYEAKEIIETLASGEDIMITGFGRFQVNEKAPRKGRNPATGEEMMQRKRKTVTFKCCGGLRAKLNDL